VTEITAARLAVLDEHVLASAFLRSSATFADYPRAAARSTNPFADALGVIVRAGEVSSRLTLLRRRTSSHMRRRGQQPLPRGVAADACVLRDWSPSARDWLPDGMWATTPRTFADKAPWIQA